MINDDDKEAGQLTAWVPSSEIRAYGNKDKFALYREQVRSQPEMRVIEQRDCSSTAHSRTTMCQKI